MVRKSQAAPSKSIDPRNQAVTLYRFAGVTEDGVEVFAHVKLDDKVGRRELVSVFINQKSSTG